MGSPILLPTPWPESPSLSHPESEEALAQLSGTVLGMPGRVLPSEHPRDLAARQSLCLYLQGGRLAPLPALEGGPGRAGSAEGVSAARGRRRGPRRRVSASLCRPPSRLPEWAGGGEQGRREGRGGAGPPPSSFHSHGQSPRAPPGPRAQQGLDVGLPPQDPL